MDGARKSAVRRLLILAGLGLLAGLYFLLCRAGGGVPCLFGAVLGVRCPSCGAATAAIAMAGLDFPRAMAANPVFTAGIFPVAGVLFAEETIAAVLDLFRGGASRSLLVFWFGRGKRG